MNARAMIFLSGWLSLPLAVFASGSSQDYVPMKVLQTSETIYPRAAKDLGIGEGEARVTIAIDEKGKLVDLLVTAYTHPAFADAAVNALRRWSYEPAYLAGEPRGATRELTFRFERQGMMVVDMTVSSYVEMRNFQLHPSAYSFHACTLRELDRIPTPTKVVHPAFPLDAAKQQKGTVAVMVLFYIDDQGKVRLPAVSRESSEASPVLAAAAVEAVAQWQFEPPLSKGRPTLVAARQEFSFKPIK